MRIRANTNADGIANADTGSNGHCVAKQHAFANANCHQYARANRNGDTRAHGNPDESAFADQAADRDADPGAEVFRGEFARAARWAIN
jgi:hypothetical protein